MKRNVWVLSLVITVLTSVSVKAQVLISKDAGKKNPHPSAILDLSDTTGGLLLPSLSSVQMQQVKTPADGLIIYNNTEKSIYIFNKDQNQWKPLTDNAAPVANLLAGADSCQWVYDTTLHKVFLVKGLALGDSIYYNSDNRKFVYTDKTTYTNSLGQTFNVEDFNGKYYFKGTASQVVADSNNLGPNLMNIIFEVDNDRVAASFPGSAVYNGLQLAAVVNPNALQSFAAVRGISNNTIHAGKDTALNVSGLLNTTSVNGTGYTSALIGLQNNTRILDSATNNIQTVFGIRNSLLNISPVSHVTGNVFDYNGSGVFSPNTINGNHYGMFLGNVTGAPASRNYAYYSNKGLNRFADSTLITDGFFTQPRAVLDINSTGTMILPSGTNAQRPVSALEAMFRYNTNGKGPEYYNGTAWRSLSADSAEWRFLPATNQVMLQRGLASHDTIFYNPVTRKFVFSDRYMNTNSVGTDFPVDLFNAKYTFKGTASNRTDTTQADGPVTNVVYEVDNAAAGTFYTALQSSAVMNPKAFQKGDQLAGYSNTTIHAGNDSVQIVLGISNTARSSGNGKSGSITGINTSARIVNGTNNNTGELVGIRNIVGRTGTTAGRVTGNVFGYQASFTGLTGFVDGNIYGVFLSNVTGAAAKKNYAFYSNKGHNRLGDSTLITDGSAISPRAVLDVNSTSAMIIPNGTSAQRPAVPVQGMMRYNNTTGTAEVYNGTQWNGTIRSLNSIDIPLLTPSTGTNISITVSGATTGSAVVVSPETALPAGIVIAWARVSLANTVDIRFENNSGSAVNPAITNFQVRVIQ